MAEVPLSAGFCKPSIHSEEKKKKKKKKKKKLKILGWEKAVLPIGIGTKDDGILISLACKSACAIIKSIAVGPGASSLEDAGIEGWAACRWICKLPTAAVLVQPKCVTSTLACNYPPFLSTIPHHLKLFWTTCFVSFSEIYKDCVILVLRFHSNMSKVRLYLC